MAGNKNDRRFRVESVRLPLSGEWDLAEEARRKLGLPLGAVRSASILGRSLDARGQRPPVHVCTLGVELAEGVETAGLKPWTGRHPDPAPSPALASVRPIVVGAGPAGLFAALRLAAHGMKPVILERGKPVEERAVDVARYFRTGVPERDSNIQFGEGGAGTYSDGKLTCRSKDPMKDWVLARFVKAGAPPETAYDARAHLGTDRLRGIVSCIRTSLTERGASYRFGTRVTGLILSGGRVTGVETDKGPLAGDAVFLAVGHSAVDSFEFFRAASVSLSAKGFAVGLRIEADQESIDRDRYGKWAGSHGLGAASFALTGRDGHGRGVYSFCMCPGGVVIPAATEPEGLVVNGMSGSKRSSRYANAAIVAEVRASDFDCDPWKGIALRRRHEAAAMELAGPRAVPAQKVADYLEGRVGPPGKSNCPWPLKAADLSGCLPEYVHGALREVLPVMIRELPPLGSGRLLGVETRTSSPVRIDRGEDMQSVSHAGLYPIGEGAGYAGGIMSSAIDGAKAADALRSFLEARNKQ